MVLQLPPSKISPLHFSVSMFVPISNITIYIYTWVFKYMYVHIHIHIHIYIYWSKPGSINTPQKQDENRGFGPGQAAGRTPGKLGGNMPVKLAKIRGKKEQQTE